MSSIFRVNVGVENTGHGRYVVFDSANETDTLEFLKVYTDNPCTLVVNDKTSERWTVKVGKSISLKFNESSVNYITIVEPQINFHVDYICKRN